MCYILYLIINGQTRGRQVVTKAIVKVASRRVRLLARSRTDTLRRVEQRHHIRETLANILTQQVARCVHQDRIARDVELHTLKGITVARQKRKETLHILVKLSTAQHRHVITALIRPVTITVIHMVRILALVLDVNRIIGLGLVALANKENLNRRRALKGRNRGNKGHLTNCLDSAAAGESILARRHLDPLKFYSNYRRAHSLEKFILMPSSIVICTDMLF